VVTEVDVDRLVALRNKAKEKRRRDLKNRSHRDCGG